MVAVRSGDYASVVSEMVKKVKRYRLPVIKYQYPSLENSMERGAWRATIYGVTKESDRT